MIVAGFGFRSEADLDALRAALECARRSSPAVDALAAPSDKADKLKPLALEIGVPLLSIDAAALEKVPTITRSAASLAARRTGSVAEAVALAAAGPNARLLGPRHISPDRRATCAIAQGAFP